MSLRIKVFLAHDPGGYDVIYPLVKKGVAENQPLEFYCVGPAAKLNPAFAMEEDTVFELLKQKIILREISILVTGTSWGSDFELKAISLCREKGIKTVCILDYWSNYALRLRNAAKTVVYPDYYIIMDELAREEAIKEGIPANILHVLGHPGLDRFIHNGVSSNNTEKKTNGKILFLSQPLSQLYGASLGYTEQSVLADCVHIVELRPQLTLHVKFHPKDDAVLKQEYDHISVHGDLMKLIPKYDLIIGMNSMGLLHAVLAGAAVISFQPNLCQPDICITNKLDLTPLITSCQSLLSLLDNLEAGKADISSEYLIHKYLWSDGKSTERVYGFLQEVSLQDEY